MEIVGDIINQVTHLGVVGSGITICGLAIGATWGIRKFFWVGQVGCKDCRNRLAEKTKPYNSKGVNHGSSKVKE